MAEAAPNTVVASIAMSVWSRHREMTRSGHARSPVSRRLVLPAPACLAAHSWDAHLEQIRDRCSSGPRAGREFPLRSARRGCRHPEPLLGFVGRSDEVSQEREEPARIVAVDVMSCQPARLPLRPARRPWPRSEPICLRPPTLPGSAACPTRSGSSGSRWWAPWSTASVRRPAPPVPDACREDNDSSVGTPLAFRRGRQGRRCSGEEQWRR